MRIEYQVIEKGVLPKRGIENMLPSLGQDGFRFAFETAVSYVFWRELPPTEPPRRPIKKPATQ